MIRNNLALVDSFIQRGESKIFNPADYPPVDSFYGCRLHPFQYELLCDLLSPHYSQQILVTRRRVGKDILAFLAMFNYLAGWRYNPFRKIWYLVNEAKVGIYFAPESKQINQILKTPASITLPSNEAISFIDLIPPFLKPKVNTQDNTISFYNFYGKQRSTIVLSQLKSKGLRGNNYAAAVITEFCTVAMSENRTAIIAVRSALKKQRSGFMLLVSTVEANSTYDWYRQERDDYQAGRKTEFKVTELNAFEILDWKGEMYEREMVEESQKNDPRLEFEQEMMNLPMVDDLAVWRKVIVKFQEERETRIKRLYDPTKPIHVGVDLGARNPAWVAAQMHNDVPHIVAFAYEKNISAIVFLRKIADLYTLKPEEMSDIYLPHDAAKRDDHHGTKTIDALEKEFKNDNFRLIKLDKVNRENDKIYSGMMGLDYATFEPEAARLMSILGDIIYSSSEVSSVKSRDAQHLADGLSYLMIGLDY